MAFEEEKHHGHDGNKGKDLFRVTKIKAPKSKNLRKEKYVFYTHTHTHTYTKAHSLKSEDNTKQRTTTKHL